MPSLREPEAPGVGGLRGPTCVPGGSQVHAPITDSEEVEADQFCENLEDLLVLTPNKDVLFIRDWIAKEGSQDMPGVTGKFGLGEQNEAGKTLTDSAKRTHS